MNSATQLMARCQPNSLIERAPASLSTKDYRHQHWLVSNLNSQEL